MRKISCTAKLIHPNRSGMVWYLAISTHTSGPVHLKMEGGEGSGSESFRDHCFACSSAPEVILFSWSFHLLPDRGYRVWSPASRTKHSVSAWWYLVPATIIFTGTGETFTSKNRHMQVLLWIYVLALVCMQKRRNLLEACALGVAGFCVSG